MQLENHVSGSTSQVKSVDLKTTILRAGAGAGKTTTLIRLFEEIALKFLVKQRRFPRIVLTTFTKKATQELRERLLANALEKKRPELFRYINQRSRVHISTIHGVLSLFLTQFGKELGLAPEFSVLETSEVKFREKRILRKLLLENPEWLELVEAYDIQTLLDMLSQYYNNHFLYEKLKPLSLEEIQNFNREVLVHAIQRGYKFYQEISVFELSGSWATYLEAFGQLKDPSAYDFDSFRDWVGQLGRKPAFSSKKPPFDESLHENFDKYLKEIKALVQHEGFQPDFCEHHEKLCVKFNSLAQAFCEKNLQERLESSALSMSDLEGLALRLIRQFPWTAERFSEQWDYWMIDEYQDTSPLQVELLKHLVGKSPHFVVGDPQQSIYLFRGARSDVFHAKVREIETLQGEVQTALKNYRSRAPLLEFINSYFSRKPAFAAMEPARDEGIDDICCDVVVVPKTEDHKEKEKLAILRLIQEKLEAGARPQEICVLARTNKILQEIAQLAFKYKMPVQVHSAGGFSSRREVMDFLSLIKFLMNPHDNLNLLSVLRSPWFHISDSQIAALAEERPRHSSFWSHWSRQKDFEKDVYSRLTYFLNMAERIGVSETLRLMMMESGMLDVSQHLDPSGRREANLWKILFDFKSAEAQPGFSAIQFIENLMLASRGEEDADATPVIEPDRINLMTIHASKGLQFKHVIIAGMGADSRRFYGDWWMLNENDGQWTLGIRSTEQKKIISLYGQNLVKERQEREAEESERLLYVAMTRARDSLSLVWSEGARKGSWAGDFPFLLTEGVHKLERFTYRVRNELPEPVVGTELLSEVGSLRPMYKDVRKPLVENNEKLRLPTERLMEKSRRGSELHLLFESLRYQPKLWENPTDELAEVSQYVKSLSEIPLRDIVQSGESGWRYAVNEEGRRFSGQIDLWARLGQEVWIVDYRSRRQGDLDSTLSLLAADAKALLKMGYIEATDRVHLVAIYVAEKLHRHKVIESARELSQ